MTQFTITENGSTKPFNHRGGGNTCSASGEFAGGIVLLESSFDGGNSWIKVAEFNSDGYENYNIISTCLLRFTVKNAAAQVNVLCIAMGT